MRQNLENKKQLNNKDFKKHSKIKLKELAYKLSRAEKVKEELEKEMKVQEIEMENWQKERKEVEGRLGEEESQRVF